MRHVVLPLITLVGTVLVASGPPMAQFNAAQKVAEIERNAWSDANDVFGLGFQGYQGSGEEAKIWNVAAGQILTGSPIRSTMHQYVVNRWKARISAIQDKYNNAVSAEAMRLTFTRKEQAAFNQYVATIQHLLGAIDSGQLF